MKKVMSILILIALLVVFISVPLVHADNAYASKNFTISIDKFVPKDFITKKDTKIFSVKGNWYLAYDGKNIDLFNITIGKERQYDDEKLIYPYFCLSKDGKYIYIFSLCNHFAFIHTYALTLTDTSNGGEKEWNSIIPGHYSKLLSAVVTDEGIVVTNNSPDISVAVYYYKVNGAVYWTLADSGVIYDAVNVNGIPVMIKKSKNGITAYHISEVYDPTARVNLQVPSFSGLEMLYDAGGNFYVLYQYDTDKYSLYFFKSGIFQPINVSVSTDNDDVLWMGNSQYFVFQVGSTAEVCSFEGVIFSVKNVIGQSGLFNNIFVFIKNGRINRYYLQAKKMFFTKCHYTPRSIVSRSGNSMIVVETNNSDIYLKTTNVSIRIEMQVNRRIMIINDKEIIAMDAPPVMLKKWNRVVVPIRYVVDVVKGSTKWNAANKTVIVNANKKTIRLQVGNPIAVVNGEKMWIDDKDHKVSPLIINGHLMVPLRFVAVQLGFIVKWNGFNQTIILEH